MTSIRKVSSRDRKISKRNGKSKFDRFNKGSDKQRSQNLKKERKAKEKFLEEEEDMDAS